MTTTIDATLPLELEDGRAVTFLKVNGLDDTLDVRVDGDTWGVRSFRRDGRHCFGRLPNLRNIAPAPIGHNNPPEDYRMTPLDALGADLLPGTVINPKELAGAKKPATWSVMPRWVIGLVGRVMSVGAAKYGAFNYRESSISASVYQDALERHLALWFDGEDEDAESGVSHLAHAIACCSLLLDAQGTGKLHDDRQKTGLVRKTLDRLEGLLVTLPLPKPYASA